MNSILIRREKENEDISWIFFQTLPWLAFRPKCDKCPKSDNKHTLLKSLLAFLKRKKAHIGFLLPVRVQECTALKYST
jgi:hypothetical protein